MPFGGQTDINAISVQMLPRLLAERQEEGLRRYGQPLRTWNGRDARRDLREELLDAFQYALQADREHRDLLRVLRVLALFHLAAGTRAFSMLDPELAAMWDEGVAALATLPREVVFPDEAEMDGASC